MTTDPTDRRLLLAVGSGDRDALGALFDRYAGSMLAAALRRCPLLPAAEEVVQEAFVDAWRRAPRYRPDVDEPWSWLLGFVLGAAERRLAAEEAPGESGALNERGRSAVA